MGPRLPFIATCAATALAVWTCLCGSAQAGGAACLARSAATVPAVVELYTSEGCSSCPPADRWLSRWQADPAVVALAFHVDYWDSLGWKDPHASAVYTQRQAQQQRSSGARFSYTPQVLVDGVDRPDWPGWIPRPARPASHVTVELARQGRQVQGRIVALPGAPARLAAYWAVTEQGHVSDVHTGENAGATLHHDAVVTDYRPVAPWVATAGGTALALDYALPGEADPRHPRTVSLVVIDADLARPVQAVQLGC